MIFNHQGGISKVAVLAELIVRICDRSLSNFYKDNQIFPPPLKPRCQGRVMGFVGGGRDIAIATALPSIIVCVLYCKHQIVYGFSLSHFLWFPEASVSGCGDKPYPASSCTCCLQNTL